LNSKKLNEKFDVKISNSEDGLVAKGRPSNHKKGGNVRWIYKYKTRDGNVVKSFRCYHCKKEGHTRKYFSQK